MKNNNEAIGNIAVSALNIFLSKSPQLMPIIYTNDKTPIWDGEIFIYKSELHSVENFSARVPIQVKGTTNTKDDFYKIERKYLEGYKNDRGCIFFLVQENENYDPSKILYAMLSSAELDTLLKKDTQTIKIELNEILANSDIFEKEIFEFARKRNGEKVENPATKEIESLVKKFDEIGKHLDEIEDKHAKYDLESLLNTIKKLKDDGTVGWRDRFVYYSPKAIELAINNIKKYDFLDLQFEMGAYLQKQKQYHLVEVYYVNALKIYRERAKDNPDAYMGDMAATLNNLASLHSNLNRPYEAEKEFQEALKIYIGLAEDNPTAYIDKVAMTLNNLAVLYAENNIPTEALKMCRDALEIFSELAMDNPAKYMIYVADTHSILADLLGKLNRPIEALEENMKVLKIHRDLAKDNPDIYNGYMPNIPNQLVTFLVKDNHPIDLEKVYKEALEKFRELSEDNPAYIGDVATNLNNLAALHSKNKRFTEAEEEYKQALKIFRELSEDNPAYIGDVATTLHKLAALHHSLNRFKEAESEYQEALEIIMELSEDNPAYIGDVATSLHKLAALHHSLNRFKEAESEYQEALEINMELSEDNPAYMGNVATILNNLADLHDNLNRFKEAERDYLDALEIYVELAKDNAIQYLDKVADTLNNLAGLYKKYNLFLLAEKVIRDAMTIYLKLSEDNPAYKGDVTNTLFNLAILYAEQKEFDKALEPIDLIIGYKYGDVDCYDFKGVLLLMKGDEQGALAMWHKVMELDPDFLSKHNDESKLHRLLKEKGLIC